MILIKVRTAESNWPLLSEERVGTGFLLEGEFADVGLSFAADSSVVPVTVGPKQKPPGEVPIVSLLTREKLHLYTSGLLIALINI